VADLEQVQAERVDLGQHPVQRRPVLGDGQDLLLGGEVIELIGGLKLVNHRDPVMAFHLGDGDGEACCESWHGR
jgi:hypothetical protein